MNNHNTNIHSTMNANINTNTKTNTNVNTTVNANTNTFTQLPPLNTTQPFSKSTNLILNESRFNISNPKSELTRKLFHMDERPVPQGIRIHSAALFQDLQNSLPDRVVSSCSEVIPSNPIQSNPIQSNPIQSNPIQSNPIQSNPMQSHL